MNIPMIFFTIIIEKRKISAQEREAHYLQDKLLKELEMERNRMLSSLPEYCYRV